MDLNNPFSDMQPITGTGAVPYGTADAIIFAVGGTIAFTTLAGTKITGFVGVAGQELRQRVTSIDNLGSATIFVGYHR